MSKRRASSDASPLETVRGALQHGAATTEKPSKKSKIEVTPINKPVNDSSHHTSRMDESSHIWEAKINELLEANNKLLESVVFLNNKMKEKQQEINKAEEKRVSFEPINKNESYRRTKCPEFAGKSEENFESWENQSKLFLKQFRNSQEEKVDILKMAVTGDAYIILQSASMNNLEEIYSALREVFGRTENAHEQLTNLKQAEDETVRKFYGKLKTLVAVSGIGTKLAGTRICEDTMLHYFVRGIRPELKKFIQHEYKMEDALQRAIKMESELTYKPTKKTDALFGIDEKPSSWKERNSGRFNPIRRQIKCYHCKLEGHSFRKCRKASKEEIKSIENNLDKHRIEDKENEKNKRTNLNSYQGPPNSSRGNPSS